MAFTPTQEQFNIHTRIREDRDNISLGHGASWKDITLYRDYANGKHGIILSEKQRQILRNLLNDKFCDNVCDQIISEANGRINFSKWECKNESVKEWLDKFYAICKIKNKQGDVHYRTLRDGNFVVAVNWSKKRNFVWPYKEDWWDGSCGVFIHYNDEEEMDYAVKEWTYWKQIVKNDGTLDKVSTTRRVIWFEDQVQKWESDTGSGPDTSWIPAPHSDDIDGNGDTQWPVPWLDVDGKPMGIPYIHFLNAKRMYGIYGASELDGGVIGFQDQLNDAQYSMSIGIKMTGAQMYYATGVKLKKDPSDKPLPIQVDAGMFHTSENDKSKFGTLPAGDIDKQIAGYNVKLKAVARMTGTPVHIISGGDWPSGEALLRAELPAVSKAWKQLNQFADSWVEVATIAMKVWNRFKPSGEPSINYDIKQGIVETVFDDPEKRDAVSRSIIVHNLIPNISIREGLRIMNYSEEKAQTIWEEMTEESTTAADTVIAIAAAKPTPGSGTSAKASTGGNNNTNSKAK